MTEIVEEFVTWEVVETSPSGDFTVRRASQRNQLGKSSLKTFSRTRQLLIITSDSCLNQTCHSCDSTRRTRLGLESTFVTEMVKIMRFQKQTAFIMFI